jgi:hypothetical protein
MVPVSSPPARLARRALTLAAITGTVLAAGCGTPTPGGAGGGGGSGGGQSSHHGPTARHHPAVLTERDGANGKTIRVSAGDKIKLVLGSSYWNVRGSSAPAVLRQNGPSVLLPVSHKCMPGVGCQGQRTLFTAVAPGTAVITAHRTTCGEAIRCVGSQGTFRLTVIVSRAAS